MTKRILCLMLCVALVLPTCIVPISASSGDAYTIADPNGTENTYVWDFEQADSNFDDMPGYGNSVATGSGTEANGNKYWSFKLNDNKAVGMKEHTTIGQILQPNSVITIDLKWVSGGLPFEVCLGRSSDLATVDNPSSEVSLAIGFPPIEDGKWYTYKIVIGEYTAADSFRPEGKTATSPDKVKVYRKERGAADSTYDLLSGISRNSGTSNKLSEAQIKNNGYAFGIGYKTGWDFLGLGIYANCSNMDVAKKNGTEYYVDNLAVFRQENKVISTSTAFEDGEGNSASALPSSGTVVPVFNTRSGATASAFAVTAAYDANDNLLYVDDAEVLIPTGLARVKAPLVDLDTLEDVSRIEAFLWDAEDTMQPLGSAAVLGTPSVVSESNATDLKYSVKANEITVEGVFDPNALVTLKAVSGSDIVYATQFKATADGSFKKVLPINYDGDVTVSVSALGKTVESSGAFAMLDNWDDFKTAFEALNSTNADAFFTPYGENFGTLLDVSTLSDTTKSNIGYLISTKNYGDLTYAEILDEVVKIATVDVLELDSFVENVTNATTIAEIRSELESTTLLNFDTTTDFICQALLDAPITGIESIWNAYIAAKNEQEAQAATQIPGAFSGIANTTGMEAFFETEITISGTDCSIAEILGLDLEGINYAVMDAAYSVICEEIVGNDTTNYEKVSEAIETLVSYTKEYEEWTAEIETKNGASAEWASIRKALDGTLDFVTAERADTYPFESTTKAAKRLADLGYENLTAAKGDLSNADAKIDFLAELYAARNDEGNIKSLLDAAKQSGWITFSVSDAECDRMVGREFDSFADITEAYEFAIGPDYVTYGIKDAIGETQIALSDFSATSNVAIEEATDYIRFTPNAIERPGNGTTYLGIVRSTNADTINLVAPNSVVTVDIRYVTKGLPFMINFAKPSAYSDASNVTRGMNVALVPRELNKWYTYKFEIGNYGIDDTVNAFTTVYVKERDAADSSYVPLNGLDVATQDSLVAYNETSNPNNMDNYGYIYNVAYTGAKQIDIGYSTNKFKHSSWTDEIYNATVTDVGLNLTVSSSAYIAKNSAFKVGDQIISKVPASGNVTPVFTVKNTGDACWVDVITVVYDKDGNMVDYKVNDEKIVVETSEGQEVSGPSVDAALAAGGGRIEAFVVDKADRMRPIGTAVLGTQADIGTSELTDVTYSTYANTVTVEGTKTAGESLVLTVKDMSDNILAVTGFKAGSDGKFKNTVAINPTLYTAGTEVKVILSNVDGSAPSSIAMSSKWKDMMDKLNGEETINASFFVNYESCFSYIDNQGATQTALDVTALTDVAFLIDTFRKAKAFEGMTSKEIIEKLIEINGKVEDGSVADFVADMNAASSADEVKELLTSEETKAFIAFDFTGVSNIVAIATNMATNGNTIQAIHTAFEAAKDSQKNTESTAASAFKVIDSAVEMQDFFQNYYTDLGTTTYSVQDAAVMYSVYDQMGYDEPAFDSADASDVIEAIKFVQNYVNEYNVWTAAVNGSQSASAEWTAIKKVFESLEFVTPELVDGNWDNVNIARTVSSGAARLEKIYARIADLGYADLVDVAARFEEDLSVNDNKVACIDEISQIAMTPNAQQIGYWGRLKEKVVNAATNGWITLDGNQNSYEDELYNNMLGKSYKYFSEVVAAYNAAMPDGGSGGGGGGGTGGGTGGDTSKDPADSIIINTGKELGGTNLNVNDASHPAAPFVDVTTEYSWAKESISGLRQYGIIRGDGDGNFRPADGISREEFLALILRVFDIETKETKASFSDVKRNEWYYSTVATAYEMGIVKGYTDGRFGIGDKVSRADMAVMVCRTLDIMGKTPAAEEAGFVFTDYLEIPEYAYNAVATLQYMGLVKGDGYRRFNPADKLTRAESAVVLWPIFNQVGKNVK